jgi:hypothetical protein
MEARGVLVSLDVEEGRYVIALNNASDEAEVAADMSYLQGIPTGVLEFDFTHMTAGLSQESRLDYLPGSFGYQPTRQLVEVTAAVLACSAAHPAFPHVLGAILPNHETRVGEFLGQMGLPRLLDEAGIVVVLAGSGQEERGEDDTTRENLIPLALVGIVPGRGPDFAILGEIRRRVERVFTQALPDENTLVGRFASIVNEAVDNLIEYGNGGLLGGLYYPRVGEVEITLVNRQGGFGGSTPGEQLDALVAATERRSTRGTGGGNGIQELSRLAMACFGTLILRNGNASLRLLPDGSIVGMSNHSGLPSTGASVTILLQLLPSKAMERTPEMREFEGVLLRSLDRYQVSLGATH